MSYEFFAKLGNYFECKPLILISFQIVFSYFFVFVLLCQLLSFNPQTMLHLEYCFFYHNENTNIIAKKEHVENIIFSALFSMKFSILFLIFIINLMFKMECMFFSALRLIHLHHVLAFQKLHHE